MAVRSAGAGVDAFRGGAHETCLAAVLQVSMCVREEDGRRRTLVGQRREGRPDCSGRVNGAVSAPARLAARASID